jgi:hypothetical protein
VVLIDGFCWPKSVLNKLLLTVVLIDGFCCPKFVLNKLLLTDEVMRTVEIHFHVPGAIIFAL